MAHSSDPADLLIAINRGCATLSSIKAKNRIAKIDHSLRRTKAFKSTREICLCKHCKGNNHLITWESRQTHLWDYNIGSCPIAVGFQIIRLNLLYKEKTNIFILNELEKIAHENNGEYTDVEQRLVKNQKGHLNGESRTGSVVGG